MSEQVLLIDDDASLRSTMKRNLGLDYTIYSAEGGEAALEVCKSEGDFSVVIVDMQMPKLNGIQTIALLREQIPEAVFVMLTGNQDLSTAIQAVNDGHVFRFLNKPCKTEEISAAIDAAQKQHNLIISEKELLSGTFAGAIKLMTDVIEMQEHRHIDTGRMAEALSDLGSRMSIELGWEEKVAARVFMLGIAMLDQNETLQFLTLDPTTTEHKHLFTKICNKSASLLSRLPRLGWIVELFKSVPTADRFDPKNERKETAAVMLRSVFYWNFLTNKGLCVEATASMIEKIIPHLTDKYLKEMQCLFDNHDSLVLKNVPVDQLQPGMIPTTDIAFPSSGKVASKGHPLSSAMVENLIAKPEMSGQKVSVFENSFACA